MAEWRDAADRKARRRADLVRLSLACTVAQLGHVDPAVPGAEAEDWTFRGNEDERLHDLAELDADGVRGLLRRPGGVRQLAHLGAKALRRRIVKQPRIRCERAGGGLQDGVGIPRREGPRAGATKEELLRQVWGYRSLGRTRTLDSHASRLRRKLHAVDPGPFVVNVWRVGYRLMD